jgi:hypothetical protein
MGGLLTVFLCTKTIIYICITKKEESYSFIKRQLEYLHLTVTHTRALPLNALFL